MSVFTRSKHIAAIMPFKKGICMAFTGSGRPDIDFFEFPDGCNWDNLEAASKAFSEYLASRGIKCSRVDCAAISDDRIMYTPIDLPNVEDASTLNSMVHMAAKAKFTESSAQLSTAWVASDSSVSGKISVGLASCGQDYLGKIETFCQLAGLKLMSAKPLAASIARSDNTSGIIFTQSGDSVGLALAENGVVVDYRNIHLADNRDFASDLDSAALMLPSHGDINVAKLLYCSDRSMASSAAAKFGITNMKRCGSVHWDEGCPQKALLGAFLESNSNSNADSLNLLDSNSIVFGSSGKKYSGKLAYAAAAFLLVCAILAWHWIGLRADISAMQARSNEISEPIKLLRQNSGKLASTDKWFDSEPWHLDLLLAVTQQFPQDDSIWVSELQLAGSGETNITGRAKTREDVLRLIEKMQASGNFDQLASHHIRSLSGSRTGVTFALSCVYVKGGVK